MVLPDLAPVAARDVVDLERSRRGAPSRSLLLGVLALASLYAFCFAAVRSELSLNLGDRRDQAAAG
jgi:hypothetical protein